MITFDQTKFKMDKKTFKIDSDHNRPVEIELNAGENETHALIHLVKSKQCKSLNLELVNEGETVVKNIAAKPFNQVDLNGYTKFSMSADLVSLAESFAEIDVYTGSWHEMILIETELSFSESPFYISCENETVAFTIGAPDDSQMRVKSDNDNKGYSVITTLSNSGDLESEVKSHISYNSEAAQVIGRLYGRMKGRIKGSGFHERQNDNIELYSENFNKTLREK